MKIKKWKICCASFFFALPLLVGNIKAEGIKGITKPYLGTYRAEKVLWGEEDVLSQIKDLKIELTTDGKMHITFKKGLFTQTHTLLYKVQDGKLLVGGESMPQAEWREIRYDKGKIVVTVPFGEKTLYALFER